MHLTTFENEIPGIILQRSKSYYEDGAVTDLQDMENGQYFAIVEGNDDYEVDLRLSDDGEVLDCSCNCPYDGGICKHVIAVLYQVREEALVGQPPEKASGQSPWKNIISFVPEDELKKFVKEMLMDIYKKQNNTKELRAIAKELYYSGRYEMKYYREYKTTFGKEEWDAESGKLSVYIKKKKATVIRITTYLSTSPMFILKKKCGENFTDYFKII